MLFENRKQQLNKYNFKMSQQQTVRVTTTETTTSHAMVINSGYLKSPPGVLKVIQFVNIPIKFTHFFPVVRFWIDTLHINFIFFTFFYQISSIIIIHIVWTLLIDFGMCLCWNRGIPFQLLPFHHIVRTIFLLDECDIYDLHGHSVDFLLDIMEYRRNHFENHLCKFRCFE